MPSNFLDKIHTDAADDTVVYSIDGQTVTRVTTSGGQQVGLTAKQSEDPQRELWNTRERAKRGHQAATEQAAAWAREIAALDAVLGDYQPPQEPEVE